MYRLENSRLRVMFDENGGITGILDRRLGREYITAGMEANACRVMLPVKEWDGRYADTAKQEERDVKVREDALTFRFSHLLAQDGIKTDVELALHYRLAQEGIHASYEIKNNDRDEAATHVMFPIVSGMERGTVNGALVMPEQSSFDDTRVQDPFDYGDGNHKDWVRGCNRKERRYPQFLVTSWMDYSDEKGGISFEQRSESFAVCDFGFERIIVKDRNRKENNREYLQFSLQSYPSVEWKKEAASPLYIIGIHEGNWQVPALQHRNWLKGHLRLPEIPESFRRSLGWHFFFMKQQDGTVYRRYQDLPAMAQAAARAGISHIMVFGWYQAGHDNEYPFGYFANPQWGGKEELLRQMEACRKSGCEVIPFFNGTLLDISTEGYRKMGGRWPVLGRTGKPYCGTEFSRANTDMGFSNASIATSTRNMTLLDICITAKEVRKWWLETVTRIVQEYGFHNLQLDQIAHKAYVCYDKSHGHKSPGSAYTTELMELLDEVRGIVRGTDGQGLMIGEGMTDLAMQYCDGFWNWHQAYNRPEIIRYSVPWLSYSHETDANEYNTVNLCFAERILLDLKIEGGDGILSDYPEFCDHLKKLSDLKKRLGPAYIEGEYFLQDQIQAAAQQAVLVRCYRKEDQTAIVAANTSDREQSGEVRMEQSLCEARVLSLDGSCQETEKTDRWEFLLKPFEIKVLEGKEGTWEIN